MNDRPLTVKESQAMFDAMDSARLQREIFDQIAKHTFKRGDLVQTWFDTGAMGATILHGEVIAAGPKRYRVRWESGLTNRLEQGYPYVERRSA